MESVEVRTRDIHKNKKMTPIQWTNEKRKVKDLLPADYNPRRITDKEKADLEYSLKRWGYVDPVVINTGSRNNILIGGHQRIALLGALERLEEEVDVRVPERELTLEEEKELNVTLNRMGGTFDWDKLFKNFDIEMLLRAGFNDEELSTLWDDVDILDDTPRAGIEKEPEEPIVPRMAFGDVFELEGMGGIKHRVMNGDSTNHEHVASLMGADRADMVYCDPPYNIGLDYSDGVTTKGKYGGSYDKNKDLKKDEDYGSFVNKTIENAKTFTKKDAHVFYWCDEKYIGLMQKLFANNGIENKRVCLWIKNNFNMTPQLAFNKVYEPCVYGTIGSPFLDKRYTKFSELLNTNIETGNQVHDEILDMLNIWLIDRETTTEYQHPTQKPINLHERPLRRCTAANHIVLDLFGGSGSTLMACDQMGRSSRSMEFDPIFCEKILRRFEKAGGKVTKI